MVVTFIIKHERLPVLPIPSPTQYKGRAENQEFYMLRTRSNGNYCPLSAAGTLSTKVEWDLVAGRIGPVTRSKGVGRRDSGRMVPESVQVGRVNIAAPSKPLYCAATID